MIGRPGAADENDRGRDLRYVSTRGDARSLDFVGALTTGLARDGGLLVPETFPVLGADAVAGFAAARYADVAFSVIAPFVGEAIAEADLRAMIASACSTFRHPAVTPLAQIDTALFVLELFHGPTLAFKDVAMQLLGRMMDHGLEREGRRATIVGATSGDTGAAAIEAFRGSSRVDVFILYPHGRVSEVQRRQMTTAGAPNIHALALEGTFDDCQAILKGLFNHHAFRDEVGLSGVNSINWGRIVAQVVYYFVAAAALGGPHRPAAFSVPTGNFGDVLAGYVARRMGLPIADLLIATNANDILVRALHGGAYDIRGVQPTCTPSMDIQISSNFERLLFEAYGRDPATIRALMANLAQSKGFDIAPGPLEAIRGQFQAASVSEDETIEEMGRTFRQSAYLLDPHTAVGVAAARRLPRRDDHAPTIVLGTAHPAKFPDAVRKATGRQPPLPDHLADLLERPEALRILPNDQAVVERYIRARRTGGGA